MFQRLKEPRTPVAKRTLPAYTRGEEIFNMVSHIVGGAFALVALVFIILRTCLHHNWWGLVAGTLYGLSMLLVYVVSSVYHGLDPKRFSTSKKILQVLDHCDIYCLVAGSVTPIVLTDMRLAHPAIAWTVFGIFYGVCILGQVFTAIDFHKYNVLSYACYFVAGWSALLLMPALVDLYGWVFPVLLILGGVFYSSGMVFFVLQKKHRYSHSVFHLFILLGSVLQFIPIYKFCL